MSYSGCGATRPSRRLNGSDAGHRPAERSSDHRRSGHRQRDPCSRCIARSRRGVDLRDKSITKYESKDETGYQFVRYFATMNGDVSVTGAPKIRVSGPDVMFQKIIYGGPAGDRFLRNFIAPTIWSIHE